MIMDCSMPVYFMIFKEKPFTKQFKASFYRKYQVTMSFASQAAMIEVVYKCTEIFHKVTETKIANIELPVVDKIVMYWQESGQQTNTVRMLVVEALKNDVTKSDIA